MVADYNNHLRLSQHDETSSFMPLTLLVLPQAESYEISSYHDGHITGKL